MTNNKPVSRSERRQITILHCDLVGSTQLMESTKQEEWQEVIHSLLHKIDAAVLEVGGTMAGFTGDGIEAFFGYPVSDGEVAIQAVECAMEIKKGVKSIRLKSEKKLKIRIGIATGSVIIEKAPTINAGKTTIAFGLTAPKAARLEEAASENNVYVDQLTATLSRRQFSFKNIGLLNLKGISKPENAFKVLRAKKKYVRFNVKSKIKSAFVGRRNQLDLLKKYLDDTCSGKGRLALVYGEPGIGKSRIIYELINADSTVAFSKVIIQFLYNSSVSPYNGFLNYFRARSGSIGLTEPKVQFELILHFIQKQYSLSDDEKYTLGSYLNIEDEIVQEPNKLDPKMKAEIMSNICLKWIKNVARKTPLILVIEDAHWADPSSQELLLKLKPIAASFRLFVLITSRINMAVQSLLKNIRTINLDVMKPMESKEMINNLAIKKIKDLDIIDLIVARSGGNPFYIEEFVNSVGSSSRKMNASYLEKHVPKTLDGILLYQLDKLPKSKEVIQLAATYGREFDARILNEILKYEPSELDRHLQALIGYGVAYKGSLGENTFIFKHALVQDMAYNSQLSKVKKENHNKISNHLLASKSTNFANSTLLAFHLEKAERYSLSFKYWVNAGKKSYLNGATLEAIDIFSCAKRTLDAADNDHFKGRLARDYYLYKAKALNATLGAQSEEAITCYDKAANESALLGDADAEIHALDSLFAIVFNSGNVAKAHKVAVRQYGVGCSKGHIIGEISGLQSLGMIDFIKGDFISAKIQLEKTLNIAKDRTYGLNCFPSLSLMYLAWSSLILGERKDGERYYKYSIESARNETSYSLMVSLGNGCYYHYFDNNFNAIKLNALELIELATDNGHMAWKRRGELFLNWANVMTTGKDTVSKIDGEIEGLCASGEEVELTLYLCLLGQAYLKIKSINYAQNCCQKAFDYASKNGENFFISMLYKLQGDIQLCKGLQNSSLKSYQAAYQLAFEQKAILWCERLRMNIRNTSVMQ